MTSIAAEAGVSISTVSKVINERPGVGQSTRDRIQELLALHGVVPRLQTSARRRIIAVFRDLLSGYTLEVVRSLIEAADDAGLDVIVGTTAQRPISHWVAACEGDDIVGLVIVIALVPEEDQRAALHQGTPLVLLDPLAEGLPHVPTVGVTDRRGAREATQHLISLGHRRIAIVAGRPSSPSGSARISGYRDALEAAGIRFESELFSIGDFWFPGGLSSGLSLLQLTKPPTAIFATNDAQALGVLESARRLGICVPTDVSVVSFDDTAAAAMASPPLTSVKQPYAEMARIAVSSILDSSSSPESPRVSRFEAATQLILRESTSSPPDFETDARRHASHQLEV